MLAAEPAARTKPTPAASVQRDAKIESRRTNTQRIDVCGRRCCCCCCCSLLLAELVAAIGTKSNSNQDSNSTHASSGGGGGGRVTLKSNLTLAQLAANCQATDKLASLAAVAIAVAVAVAMAMAVAVWQVAARPARRILAKLCSKAAWWRWLLLRNSGRGVGLQAA